MTGGSPAALKTRLARLINRVDTSLKASIAASGSTFHRNQSPAALEPRDKCGGIRAPRAGEGIRLAAAGGLGEGLSRAAGSRPRISRQIMCRVTPSPRRRAWPGLPGKGPGVAAGALETVTWRPAASGPCT